MCFLCVAGYDKSIYLSQSAALLRIPGRGSALRDRWRGQSPEKIAKNYGFAGFFTASPQESACPRGNLLLL
jgi:hypothetical protein